MVERINIGKEKYAKFSSAFACSAPRSLFCSIISVYSLCGDSGRSERFASWIRSRGTDWHNLFVLTKADRPEGKEVTWLSDLVVYMDAAPRGYVFIIALLASSRYVWYMPSLANYANCFEARCYGHHSYVTLLRHSQTASVP